jgi:hypothetical protein
MLPGHLATVAAFIDGEAVDGVQLNQALATDEGREYLVDLLALRQCVSTMGPLRLLATPRRARPPAAGRQVAERWAAVAAFAVLASLGGFLVGERAGVAAEVQSPQSAVEVVAAFDPAPRAPQPTRVIQLRAGVNPSASEGN